MIAISECQKGRYQHDAPSFQEEGTLRQAVDHALDHCQMSLHLARHTSGGSLELSGALVLEPAA